MKIQAALFLLSCVLFLGCKPAKEKEPQFTNLPPELKAQLDTPKGREMLAAAKELQAENTRKKLKLLNNTDHSTLFEACKLVITNRRAWEKSNYGVEQSLIAGKSTNLPPIIKALGASSLSATDRKLTFELGAGFHHFGVVAVIDGSAYEASARVNTKKLHDGLWFYEEAR